MADSSFRSQSPADAAHGSRRSAKPWLRRLVAAGLRARFRWFQAHRYRELVLERIGGIDLLVLPEVFNPALFRTGGFWAEALIDEVAGAAGPVLELGTGTGIGAIAVALTGRDVTATDVTEEAVRCARINGLLNGVEQRLTLRQGDLFDPVGDQKFSRVAFHPPFWRGEARDRHEIAFRAEGLAERFARGLADRLTDDGKGLLLLSSDGSADFVEQAVAHGFAVEPARRRDLGNEVLTCYRLERS